MSAAAPENDIQSVPRLLVELPSRQRVFFENLSDLIFPRRLPRLELRSAPAPFWHDVFVKRPLPWTGFFRSIACHLIAIAVLLGVSRFLALRPRAVPHPALDHAQVIYYSPSEYLPPIDTRIENAPASRKDDPELSRQPIISLPREADNRSQTIVTPAVIKLKRDLAMPNMVAWSDTVKPRLYIPPTPITPAAQITRTAPEMNSVIAPPSDVRASRSAPGLNAANPALIAPPPNIETAHTRTLGDLNIGHSAVINPAPQLAVGEQRVGGRSSAHNAISPQIVAPPSSIAASSGSPGRIIALSLHPAIVAPPDSPQGNRRGIFSATPATTAEGHAGATGSPAGNAVGNSDSSTAGKRSAGDIPAGLYVGSAPAKSAPVAGNPGPSADPARSNLAANVHPPHVKSAPMHPGDYDALTEPERAVFAGRKFYSLTLNLPNLNSAGGSWIVRFAEMKHDDNHDAEAASADPSAGDPPSDDRSSNNLSQPTATRKVDPGYPIQLMRENIAGTVILYAVIRADGTVGDVRVLRGVDDRLDSRASQAVAQWQFQPATKNGTPVDVEATFQIPFKPARVGSNF